MKNIRNGSIYLMIFGGAFTGLVINQAFDTVIGADTDSFNGVSVLLGVIMGLLWEIAHTLQELLQQKSERQVS
ncbi:hypothetical protein LC040_11015 [Bacillus tianshenii]|nr:hypothetical protein LC040_11015 [Bacillus tianshenii]